MRAEFRLGVTESGAEYGIDADGHQWDYRWAFTEEAGDTFVIPHGLVEKTHCSDRRPIGS
jgi:hypothetical protein